MGWVNSKRSKESVFCRVALSVSQLDCNYLQPITSQFLFLQSVLLVPLTHKSGIIDADSAGHSVTSGYLSAKPEEPNRKCLTHIKKHRAM